MIILVSFSGAIKYTNNSRYFGHFKLVIFNDYDRNYIENDDAIINVWFIEEPTTSPLPAIVSVQSQSLKEDKDEDISILMDSNVNNTSYSIIGDASCNCYHH